MVRIDDSRCANCDLCYEVCIGGQVFKGPSLRETEEFPCVECGHCYAICPEGAVTLERYEDIETSELALCANISETPAPNSSVSKRAVRRVITDGGDTPDGGAGVSRVPIPGGGSP